MSHGVSATMTIQCESGNSSARASCISKVAVVTGLEARPGTSQQGNM